MLDAAVSRRGLLVAGAAAGGLAVASAAPPASAAPTAAATGTRARTPAELRLHLLRRATFGPTPHDVHALSRTSLSHWVDHQLAPAAIDDAPGDAVRALYPGLRWSIPQARAHLDEFSWDLMFLLGQATIGLAAWSRRQLFEVMVDFWSNHLNVTNPSDNVWDNRHHYDRAVIRKHALGRFDDMLVASAKHPAMLRFLNQADSTKDAPNENYGRELLELHTVGIDGGYTERMMVDSARIMTGYTVDSETGTFVYDPSIHWRGKVKVLGFSAANATAHGHGLAERYLRYLAHRPATAHHIARKLVTRFVSDHPPSGLVDHLAKVYLAHHTNIRPVLRELFTSKAFHHAPTKLRRPYEDIIATLRVLDVGLHKGGDKAAARSGVESLYWMVDSAGQAPLAWGLPDGYPDVATAWQSAGSALGRWNTHQSLAAGWWPDSQHIKTANCNALLPAKRPATYGGLVDALSHRLLFHRLPDKHRRAALAFCGVHAGTHLPADSEWLGWRLSHLVALILDAPAHLDR
jgi:uncharacterized protein (DUF1800 family)